MVVPEIGGGSDALVEDPGGIVLAHFELVADHGHFAIEIGARDAGVNHTVGFEFEAKAKILLGGGHGFEVIGAVEIGGGVKLRAVGTKLRHDVLTLFGALEHHVFQQVGHAGFAIPFVAGADHIRDVDGDGGLGIVGE
jgi:hypothetical protein